MKAFLILALLCSIVHAELILQPADLNPGDQYRLVFVTSQTRNGRSSSIAVYDDFVQSVADAAPILGDWNLEWKVFGSTQTVDARDHLNLNPESDPLLPVYRVNGEQFSTGNIFTNTQGPIQVTELDDFPTEFRVFTGSDRFGVADSFQSSPGYFGRNDTVAVGSAGGGGNGIFFNGVEASGRSLSFYAFSEVITAVPEPSGSLILLTGVSLLLGFRKRR